jgi:hypothetical protein
LVDNEDEDPFEKRPTEHSSHDNPSKTEPGLHSIDGACVADIDGFEGMMEGTCEVI